MNSEPLWTLFFFFFFFSRQSFGHHLFLWCIFSFCLPSPFKLFLATAAGFSTEQGGLSADVIKKAFKATEEDFTHFVKKSLPVKPQIASVGSCCLFGAISNGELYVANLGDSRAVLGRRGFDGEPKYVAERLSTDHNVSCPDVRREVEALHPDDEHVVVYCRGVWRIRGIIQVIGQNYGLIIYCTVYVLKVSIR